MHSVGIVTSLMME
jgi:AGZA family xanthine/uracil permease-like MFS transporter